MRKSVINIIICFLVICSCIQLNCIVFADEQITCSSETGNSTEITNDYMLLGDADNNNKVNADDALKILKIAADIEDMGADFSIRKNDCDYNYTINAQDALTVLMMAAGIQEEIIIDDPMEFYQTINYINGYPEHDYISGYLHKDVEFTIEEGKTWDIHTYVQILKYENSDRDGDIVYGKAREDGFDKLYWELRWLIEDAKKNAQIEAVSDDIDLYDGFTGYRYDLVTYAPCLNSNKAYISVFISDDNEMYFSVVRRFDLYEFEKEDGAFFKFTGEIPDNLKYESIVSYYEKYKSE